MAESPAQAFTKRRRQLAESDIAKKVIAAAFICYTQYPHHGLRPFPEEAYRVPRGSHEHQIALVLEEIGLVQFVSPKLYADKPRHSRRFAYVALTNWGKEKGVEYTDGMF